MKLPDYGRGRTLSCGEPPLRGSTASPRTATSPLMRAFGFMRSSVSKTPEAAFGYPLSGFCIVIRRPPRRTKPTPKTGFPECRNPTNRIPFTFTFFLLETFCRTPPSIGDRAQRHLYMQLQKLRHRPDRRLIVLIQILRFLSRPSPHLIFFRARARVNAPPAMKQCGKKASPLLPVFRSPHRAESIENRAVGAISTRAALRYEVT